VVDRLHYWTSFRSAALGGVLGVMYSIPCVALVTNSDCRIRRVSLRRSAESARCEGVSAEAAAESNVRAARRAVGSMFRGFFAVVSRRGGVPGDGGDFTSASARRVVYGFDFPLVRIVGSPSGRLWVGIAMLVGAVIGWVGRAHYSSLAPAAVRCGSGNANLSHNTLPSPGTIGVAPCDAASWSATHQRLPPDGRVARHEPAMLPCCAYREGHSRSDRSAWFR